VSAEDPDFAWIGSDAFSGTARQIRYAGRCMGWLAAHGGWPLQPKPRHPRQRRNEILKSE
jgi:hypothetical protein